MRTMTDAEAAMRGRLEYLMQFQPRSGLSVADARALLEERLKEAQRIDPRTCEITYLPTNEYNIFDRWVRNVPDGIWVCADDDLPDHIYAALNERVTR